MSHRIFTIYFVCLFLIILVTPACQKPEQKPVTTLRSTYYQLSYDIAKKMVNKYDFYDKRWNKNGRFAHKFDTKTIDKDKVIFDYSTNLMWHHSGSAGYMTYAKGLQWLDELNKKKYAGHDDWRLPTLEEAASLLKKTTGRSDLYLAPVFSRDQLFIWTGDLYSENINWVVSFTFGSIYTDSNNSGEFVKPVRSLK